MLNSCLIKIYSYNATSLGSEGLYGKKTGEKSMKIKTKAMLSAIVL
ncbi:hypothetical protein AGMMS49936_04050 [Endomicrobiia bacterium]|nr:hypothetical protein AGMMS49936_04050 [Endomicrobiia bacterium]